MGNQQSLPINRRCFLAMGLAVPFGALPACHQPRSLGLFPISMDRCVVVFHQVQRDYPPTWPCQVHFGTLVDQFADWWLVIRHFEGYQPALEVVQPSSALLHNSGLSGLLAARITFRLHVLLRRGTFHGEFSQRRIVQQVNRQILKSMENLPS